MTDLREPAVDPDAIRSLVLDARGVLERVRQFPQQADSEVGRRWASYTEQGLRSDWQQLLSILNDGDATYLRAALHAFVAEHVPLSEAPPELRTSAAEVIGLLGELNGELRLVMPGLTAEDGSIRPEIEDELGATMRSVAADLPG